MEKSEPPRRRFAPVPIETTFETFRSSTGKQKRQVRMRPEPELTPEPSPRSPSPVPRELQQPSPEQPKPQPPRRRFAPQLIETSRRSRRVGDTGPATKPTDKTDISPYTRNIYTATKQHRDRKQDGRSKERTQDLASARREIHESSSPILRVSAPMRRESEDENVTRYLLELAAKEAERQMQEVAMAAFPNSHAREGGIDHFYFRDSSESDNSPESASPSRKHSNHGHIRRSSVDQPINWWHKHMQEHAEFIAKEHDEMVVDQELPLDGHHEFPHTEMDALPEADSEEDDDIVMGTDSDLDRMDLTAPPDPMWTTSRKTSSPGVRGPIGESFMPLIQADPYVTSQSRDKNFTPSPSPRPVGEASMPFIPSSSPTSQILADTRKAPPGPFGRPFGGLGYKSATPQFQKRRPMVSPPMLGKDLVFRRCPSPKQTKLEPDHPFAQRHAEERYRDVTGQKGLWRGYCYRSESNDESLVPADLHAPPMLGTLQPPAVPGQPHISHVNHFDHDMWEEPDQLETNGLTNGLTNGAAPDVETRGRSREPKGLHPLQTPEKKFQRRERNPELDEKIAQEFDDTFVTQVYNYLSLGYPAMARAYDEELSQISLMSIEELEQDDEKQLAKGHLVEADRDEPRDQRCPRWKALHSYIFEWARQHPNLDTMDPVAWGVRERRGSWAI
ncbi:hypothetical protein BGZ63DRAFT_365194 [Mariannaea sp. PMI_226]|nr:hypothetical protein BGZ63DRAFT_365194 [Mariannaea sp. PMI_226]